eukprot:symbB.v1.2.005382.t1/scaffold315.1/size251361/11
MQRICLQPPGKGKHQPFGCSQEEAEESGGKVTGRALEVSEMSVGFYYLLLEHRNAAAVDPDRVLREHEKCLKVEASVLDELTDCIPLGCTVAYATNAAEAQRQLRLLGNWELVRTESYRTRSQLAGFPGFSKAKMDIDLLNPDAKEEKCKHKLKRMIQSPNSFFMDVKCPGCLQITTVFSHAQTVVLCGNCNVMLCQPTGGLARLTEGCSFRRKAD